MTRFRMSLFMVSAAIISAVLFHVVVGNGSSLLLIFTFGCAGGISSAIASNILYKWVLVSVKNQNSLFIHGVAVVSLSHAFFALFLFFRSLMALENIQHINPLGIPALFVLSIFMAGYITYPLGIFALIIAGSNKSLKDAP